MIVRKGVEIIDGTPILYIKELSALVCSDLHLGYEGVMSKNGIFLPKVNLNKIEEVLGKAVDEKNPEKIIIDGDIKNEFSEVHPEEFNELQAFVDFLRKKDVKEIILVKGNHDNFVDRLKMKFDIKVYQQEAEIGDYLFFHGEELPQGSGGKLLVMGHIHPAIVLYNKLGIKEKLKCFLYGKMADGREIIVLPAMNYFAEGVGVNSEKVDDMAPVFKEMLDINNMEALCIGSGETLDFGRIKELKEVIKRQ